MNQIPASILILTSSILAYAATGTSEIARVDGGMTTTHTTTTGVILGLGALILGIWGVISLITASVHERELAFDGTSRSDLLGMLDPRRMAARQYAPVGSPVAQRTAPVDPAGVALSPEMKAQLSMAAHLEGRERSQIVEEALRRYLPRYENSSKAA